MRTWPMAARAIALGATAALTLGTAVATAAPSTVDSGSSRPQAALPAPSLLASALPAAGGSARALPAAAADHRVTLRASWSEFRKGESLRLTGTVDRRGNRLEGVSVTVWAATSRGAAKKVATTTTNAKGSWSVWVRPDDEVVYTARAKGAESLPLTVARTTGRRHLEDRARILGPLLGAARSKVKTLSRAQRQELGKGSVTKVRYRDYDKGMLVEVTVSSGTVRTWLVRGKILTAYRKAGGPRGDYGVPTADVRCNLMEHGCLQRFTRGSLYEKRSQKKAFGQKGTSKATELLAVARSQLSYRSTRLKSKYNKWTSSVGQPWCSAFQSWVAAASGNPQAIPKYARIFQLAAYARKNMTTFKNGSKKHKPKMGTLAFFDFRNGGRGPEPSHVGMVIKNKKNTVVTLEGNASKTASFTSKRGVFIHERPKSRVVFYAYPNW